jgi:hypothetical protein
LTKCRHKSVVTAMRVEVALQSWAACKQAGRMVSLTLGGNGSKALVHSLTAADA